MAVDGIFLYNLKQELAQRCENARVEKVYQPSRDELALFMRGREYSGRLFICIRPSAARIHFTKNNYENPAQPPMFCMLLRKHLQSARFIGISDDGFERMATLAFDSINEMGDHITLKLVIELIGRQTNIILVGNDGRIIDCIHRSDIETSERLVQPGALYIPPPAQGKMSATESVDTLVFAICSLEEPATKAIIDTISGVSPLIAREIAYIADIEFDFPTNQFCSQTKNRLKFSLENFRKFVGTGTPVMLKNIDGEPKDFTFMPITQYGNTVIAEKADGYSELLDTFYDKKDKIERMRGFSNELMKYLNTLRSRITRKINVRREELKKCGDCEKYRIYGELIKANIHCIDRGSVYAEVKNYYDPELKTERIPINVALSPAENAQKYFKDYRKCCNALATLGQLIEEGEKELIYIESVIDELSRAEAVSELTEIKSELIDAGYLPSRGARRKPGGQFKPLEYITPGGYRVCVGRNNKQNDELTLKTASRLDMWFHTKNIPGSHVIVFSGGNELSSEDIMFAATLAATHSKAAGSAQIPVDYTQVLKVKKPAGAKPGMVIYHTNSTVYVTPKF